VNVLLAVIQSAGVKTAEQEIVTDALQRFGAMNVDFPDAWLAARAAQLGCEVASFDRDFDKFKDIRRFDPGDAA
jgi:predicted nucleic acid-binding protein